MWEKIKVYCDTNYLMTFLFGVIVSQIYKFVKEGGMNGEFPMSECLFYMSVSMLALGLLSVPQLMNIKRMATEAVIRAKVLEDFVLKCIAEIRR
jgi:hypothetical protein